MHGCIDEVSANESKNIVVPLLKMCDITLPAE